MTNTPRALLIEDYREKCAKMEDDMLGWKESAEAWERDARGLSDRLKWMADRQRDLLALVDKQAEELGELRLLKRMLGEPLGNLATLSARAEAAEVRAGDLERQLRDLRNQVQAACL